MYTHTHTTGETVSQLAGVRVHYVYIALTLSFSLSLSPSPSFTPLLCVAKRSTPFAAMTAGHHCLQLYVGVGIVQPTC